MKHVCSSIYICIAFISLTGLCLFLWCSSHLNDIHKSKLLLIINCTPSYSTLALNLLLIVRLHCWWCVNAPSWREFSSFIYSSSCRFCSLIYSITAIIIYKYIIHIDEVWLTSILVKIFLNFKKIIIRCIFILNATICLSGIAWLAYISFCLNLLNNVQVCSYMQWLLWVCLLLLMKGYLMVKLLQ